MVGWLLGGCELGNREGRARDLERGIFLLVVGEGCFRERRGGEGYVQEVGCWQMLGLVCLWVSRVVWFGS